MWSLQPVMEFFNPVIPTEMKIKKVSDVQISGDNNNLSTMMTEKMVTNKKKHHFLCLNDNFVF